MPTNKRKIIIKKKEVIKPKIINKLTSKEIHFKKLNTVCKKAFNKPLDVLATNFNPFLGSKFSSKLRNYAAKEIGNYIYEKTKSKSPETRKDFLELFENAKKYVQTTATMKFEFHLNHANIKRYIN